MPETFPKVVRKAASKIGEVTIRVIDRPARAVPVPATPATTSIEYAIEALADDGNGVDVLTGDLTPYLSPAQITAIKNLATAIRTKAAEVI